MFLILFILFTVIGFFGSLYNSPTFRGFCSLPKAIDKLVYSFFYTEEKYPIASDFGLSSDSTVYNIRNPKDGVVFSMIYFPSLKNSNKITNDQKEPNKSKRPLIIWLRGNGAIIYRAKAIKEVQDRLDVDVALINYRGSFEELSRNQVTRQKIRSDNQVAMRFIRKHFLTNHARNSHYYLYGLSIGSAICSDMVLDNLLYETNNQKCVKLKGVILDNVFTSLSSSFVVNIRNSSIGANIPKWAASIVSKTILAFCGETYVNTTTWKNIREFTDKRNIQLSLLVFSSGKDNIMDPLDGQKIANIMPNKTTRFVMVDEALHGCCSDFPVFYDEIEQFVS